MTSLLFFQLIVKILCKYISEAIIDDKINYYKAINHTRYSHNGLTYFLTY